MDIAEKMKKGLPVTGTFTHLGGGTAAECLSLTGLDFIVIDTEHAPYSAETVQDMLRAMQPQSCRAFVRVKDVSRPALLRMLDVGADALIIPDVHTLEEVKQIVRYCKYFPVGSRGFAFSRSTAYGTDEDMADVPGYFRKVNREKWVIPQCETLGALESIEKIAALEGVDGIFVGPYDLSVAFGKPAVFDTPEFQQAIDRVLAACKEYGKLAMIFAGTTEQVRHYSKQGFDMVAVGTDTTMLMNAYRDLLKNI